MHLRDSGNTHAVSKISERLSALSISKERHVNRQHHSRDNTLERLPEGLWQRFELMSGGDRKVAMD